MGSVLPAFNERADMETQHFDTTTCTVKPFTRDGGSRVCPGVFEIVERIVNWRDVNAYGYMGNRFACEAMLLPPRPIPLRL